MKTRNAGRVLAIDPGTRHMGIAILDGQHLVYHGVKTIPKLPSPHERLEAARELIFELFRDFQPSVVVVEKTFFARNRSAALLNVLGDEIRAIGISSGIPIKALAPTTVKKLVCGHGHAPKPQVARAIAKRFPELKAYLGPDRRWKREYHENMFDAVALGVASLSQESV